MAKTILQLREEGRGTEADALEEAFREWDSLPAPRDPEAFVVFREKVAAILGELWSEDDRQRLRDRMKTPQDHFFDLDFLAGRSVLDPPEPLSSQVKWNTTEGFFTTATVASGRDAGISALVVFESLPILKKNLPLREPGVDPWLPGAPNGAEGSKVALGGRDTY
jgi:hypothetical protein